VGRLVVVLLYVAVVEMRVSYHCAIVHIYTVSLYKFNIVTITRMSIRTGAINNNFSDMAYAEVLRPWLYMCGLMY
ncbi:MAG: hypothetical protein ACKPKO_31805, partial [Candidatus Fonsibacter sp.]